MLREIETPEGFEREVRVEPKTNWMPAFKVLALTSPDVEILINFYPNSRDSYSLASGHVSFDTPLGRRTFDRYGVEDSFYIDNPRKWIDAPRAGDRVVHGKSKMLGTVTQGPGYREFGENRKDSYSDETTIVWDSADGAGTKVVYTKRQLSASKIAKADVIEQANHTIKQILEVRIPEARARLAQSERVPGIPFEVTPERKQEVTRTLASGSAYSFTPSGFGTGYRLFMKRDRYSRGIPGGSERAREETERFFGISPIYVETFDAD